MIGRLQTWFANRNKQTCDICKGTEGEVLREEMRYLSWSYHQECLKNVVCDPAKYPDWVGYAYKLTRVIEQRKAKEKKELLALIRLQPKYECKP